ncbi:ATP-binding cassette domain-containing protein [Paenibacillus zeisoli]|uniref:ATP-binding cassette domain-containing protein n=1 Tax=Paenibacillus zeisoli TaxID=2496267 RepID=A0A3S1B708_9BACL|nr:amino acid ABC transporter ATP-binding/permease protein [Paenibacillus zeisoli]RUT33428.1 ATP-binding cassette domain-containing protein [Paenibacillus zeisoli]
MRQEGWLKPYIKAHLGRFILIIFLGVLTAAAASMLMFTSGYLISKSALRPENILLVYVPIVGVRTFGISRAVLHYVERLAGHDAVLRIVSRMRVRLYNTLEPDALSLRSQYRTGDILGVLAEDIEQLQNVYLRTAFPGAIAVVMYAAVIAALGRFDGAFALMTAGLLLILLGVLPCVSLLMTARTQERMKQERSRLYQKLTDAVMGLGTWVISGRTRDFLASYEADEARITRADRTLKRWARIRALLGQLVVLGGVLLMMSWSAGKTADGSMSGTLIAAFVLVVFPLMDVFLPVSEAVEKLPRYRNSLDRLNEISSAGREEAAWTAGRAEATATGPGEAVVSAEGADTFGVADATEAVGGVGATEATEASDAAEAARPAHKPPRAAEAARQGYERPVAAVAAPPAHERPGAARGASALAGAGFVKPIAARPGLERPRAAREASALAGAGFVKPTAAHIRLDQVSFSYGGNAEAAVRGITLDIPQGRRIAVIGRSGAGKSTLLGLIQGAFTPDAGAVRINGVAAGELGDHIPEVISVLNQRPHLFDTSVANNIRLGRSEASNEEICQAAEQAQLAALIASLSAGYDTPMRETGQRFSGGERQRVALARILLQDTPVVILDEPAVGLDPRTERELMRTIMETTTGKSLIWVTHHLAGTEQMDEIIFMEDGRIEMRGTHEELMERYPRYRKLYQLDRPIPVQ